MSSAAGRAAGAAVPAPMLRETPEAGLPSCELDGWRQRWGIVAGITTAEVDLGLWTGAPVGEVMERWREFRRSRPGMSATVLAHQVHGTRVLRHAGAAGWQIHDGADGHVTRDPGVLLTVTVADCVPVYLAAPAFGAVGLLHAGWRGTAGGILPAGVEALTGLAGCGAQDVVAHVGVAICGRCYEVGEEVARACGLDADGEGPWHVDLRDVLVAQARALGVRDVTRSPWCTAHDGGRFHSHRASGGRAGRMVAYAGIPGAGAGG